MRKSASHRSDLHFDWPFEMRVIKKVSKRSKIVAIFWVVKAVGCQWKAPSTWWSWQVTLLTIGLILKKKMVKSTTNKADSIKTLGQPWITINNSKNLQYKIMLVALLTVTYHLLGFSLHQAVLGHLESWGHPKIISHHNHQDIKSFRWGCLLYQDLTLWILANTALDI